MADTTPSNAAYELIDLTLSAVALCKEGANSRAHIILTKNKPKGDQSMTFEELLASLKPEQATVIKEHLKAEKKPLEERIEAFEKAVPATPEKEEEILKDATPELKIAFEKMQGLVDTLVKEKAEQMADKLFEKCKAIPVEESTLKEVLKAASPATVSVLEAASAAIAKTTLEGAGANSDGEIPDSDSTAAFAQLETTAKSIQAADASLTYEQAFLKACTNKPELYAKYSKGVR